MDKFTNSVLLPENMPEVEHASFNLLNKKYLVIQIVRIAAVFLLLAGGLAAYILFAQETPGRTVVILAATAILLLTAWLTVMVVLGFPKKGYLVREKDVSYQRGLITYRIISVPFSRIQHVEVDQGVLSKLLGLSAVKIYTAGGTSSDLSIPGLSVDEAKKIRAFLSGKINEHE